MQKPTFWLSVGKIIWINVLLSGDNALVIAMACRGLHGRNRLWGMVIGAGIAVVLLITFTGVVATLMSLPYLKLVGGLALIVIAAKLQLSLLVLGLAISIPVIIAGAALIMLVLDRLPVLVWLGAMLLGWIAGDVISSDPVDQTLFHGLVDGHITIEGTSAILGASHFNLDGDLMDFVASTLGAIIVLIVGSIWRSRKLRDDEHDKALGAAETVQRAD